MVRKLERRVQTTPGRQQIRNPSPRQHPLHPPAPQRGGGHDASDHPTSGVKSASWNALTFGTNRTEAVIRAPESIIVFKHRGSTPMAVCHSSTSLWRVAGKVRNVVSVPILSTLRQSATNQNPRVSHHGRSLNSSIPVGTPFMVYADSLVQTEKNTHDYH